jgi:hypothetical protein
MRENRKILLPSVLMLTLVALLVAPIVAAASSGLPATVTMNPAAAAPGATVEVVGLDFPGLQVVDVELATAEGAVPLVSTVTAQDGWFREVVVLPATLPSGAWELHAVALDGASAGYAFHSGIEAIGATTTPASPEMAATAAGSSGLDIAVMLIVAVLIAAVGGGAVYAWREVSTGDEQPGMGYGDDPIWSGAADQAQLDLSATDEPIWSVANSES